MCPSVSFVLCARTCDTEWPIWHVFGTPWNLRLKQLVSCINSGAVGWVVFFFIFRTEKDIDLDAAIAEEADIQGPPRFSLDPEARHEPEP